MPVTIKSLAASHFLLPALLAVFTPGTAAAQPAEYPDVLVAPYSPAPGGSSDVMVMPGSVDHNPPRGLALPRNRRPPTLGSIITTMDNPASAKTNPTPVVQPTAPADTVITPGAVQTLPAQVDPREVPPLERPSPGEAQSHAYPPEAPPVDPYQPGVGKIVSPPAQGMPSVPGVEPGQDSGMPSSNEAQQPRTAKPPPLPKMSPRDLLPVPKE